MTSTTEKSNLPESVCSIIVRLFECNAVKFGDFKLKSGIQSPVYFDLRVMISYPNVMVDVANLLWESATSSKFKLLCGVPYTALPIATLMSAKHNVPMLIRRKEAKDYGTKKLIEGVFVEGERCLIVEDVVSSGSSVYETAQTLQAAGLQVTDAVVLLDREQGGLEKLAVQSITLHSVFTMTDVLCVLRDAGKMEAEMVTKVSKYISENRFKPNEPVPSSIKPKTLSFGERAAKASNPISSKLFDIMESKKTNLAVSADFTTAREILNLAEKTGSYICILKIHADIVEDFSEDFVKKLQALAAKHNFMIFEDRKFADIGNTVLHQYNGGLHHISKWAHIVNAHTVPGSGVVQGLKKVGQEKGCGCLLIAEMSSAGNLATGTYTQATVKMAEDNQDFVIGFICVSKLSSNPSFLHMTPGVQLQEGKDSMGQQYLTPKEVVTGRGSDIIIVGRGIYQAADPVTAAQEYRTAGFDAYLATLTQ